MEPHPLSTFTATLVEKYGRPQILDVDHSIQVFKPTLSGSRSPSSYYIRPPDGMSAETLIEWFESAPGFPEYVLTLTSILGLDTYHQPLISSDEFAKKYFLDNHVRVVRVVGKSNHAIEAMAAFVDALKRPFDASVFPHHGDFAVSGERTSEAGRINEIKLLFKPADANVLMKVERLVVVHLAECNLGREIHTSRHSTRGQAPELILTVTLDTSANDIPAGSAFLQALAQSLPKATSQEVTDATEVAQKAAGQSAFEPQSTQARYHQPQAPSLNLSSVELRKTAIARLSDILKGAKFANGAEIKIVQGGNAIEVNFPRTASSLWLSTSFNEAKHVKEVVNSCVGVRSDPRIRDGWSAHYNFDSKTGNLYVRAVDKGSEPPSGWKAVPFIN